MTKKGYLTLLESLRHEKTIDKDKLDSFIECLHEIERDFWAGETEAGRRLVC